ncbi:MAG: D-alanyl-D-alanine carboxypeptidase family protein [Polyangiaceae bacterium]|nr:D-alanyl-D-alanine carboxypeptidase family protein [Polyangiaceae bacterium]
MTTRHSSLFVTTFALAFAAAPLLTGCMAEPTELADEEVDGLVESPEPTEVVEDSATGTSVLTAAGSSCSTGSVKGLSKQIIAEARCMNANAYVAINDLGNVSWSSIVFPYIEKPARDKLVAALNANKGKTMTINSALRTVAQQYLLYRWYQTGRCGISLAAKPGNSNHETGLALDVSQYSTWKPILTNYGFKWLGSSDPWHFDYVGAGAVSHKGLDVKAFQRLWNRNNPGDKIAADGIWGPQTEARMKKAPAGGFATGATCGSAILEPEVERLLDEDDFGAIELNPVQDVAEEVEHESCADGAH